MTPTVGRIVHYTNLGDADGKYPPETQAAIITAVKPHEVHTFGGPPDKAGEAAAWEAVKNDEVSYKVDLHVFYRTGDFFMLDVPFSREPQRGHWTWPPRV